MSAPLQYVAPIGAEPVRFPRVNLVHARSAFRKFETACGLGGIQAPDLEKTDAPIDCKACLRTLAIRRRPSR